MISHLRTYILLLLTLFAVGVAPAFAQEDDPAAISPLRLSYLEGDVGFWRYGAEDWTDARLNTPLAAGDALYVDGEGILELQLGSRAFIRASDDTELSVVNQTADFLQLKVTNGRVSLDLRSLPSRYTIEVNTPNSVFTIERAGYYRVEVDDEVHFVTRRGGEATLVPAGGRAMSIYPSEEIVVEGTNVARAETYVAPELDSWDRWNYDRSEDLMEAASERYLSSEIAGASDLDRYGRWRVVANYGTVWVPDNMGYGWAPYSTGRWVWDPYYQWTWIDDSPWGWAPYHYGRWVHLDGYWAWAPGPVVRRAVYAPALVAFYGVGSGVSLSIGGSLGWVALSWGEPVVPWWGRSRFIGRPYWGGWGGPRVVNNVVIKNTTVVNITNIQYVNARVNNALIATPRERFGKGYVQTAPSPIVQTQKHTPLRGALPVKPEAASVMVGSPGKARPPERISSRPVVATRAPSAGKVPWGVQAPRSETRVVKQGEPEPRAAAKARPEERYVTVPKRSNQQLERPQFGERAGEERPRPAQPPRYNEKRESPPPFESRVREQREDEGREVKPLREFKPLKEPASPQESRSPNPPRDAAEPREPKEQREPRAVVPEAMPHTERDKGPQRPMREAEPQRPQAMPEREVKEQREPEPQRPQVMPGRDPKEQREPRAAVPEAMPRTERDKVPQRPMREAEQQHPQAMPERESPQPRAIPGPERGRELQQAEPRPREVAPDRPAREKGRSAVEVLEERHDDRPLPGNAANRMYRGPEKKQQKQEGETKVNGSH